jgi:hypothetical protein
MNDLRTYTAAHAGGSFAPVARLLAAAARACRQHGLAALHRSREREAMRVIVRYRHVSQQADAFYQRKISAKQVDGACGANAPGRARAPQWLYIDPMQGMR